MRILGPKKRANSKCGFSLHKSIISLTPLKKTVKNIMSETTELVVLQKKRMEMENQWSSQLQKQKTLEGDIKTLEEKLHAQLQEKIKTEDTVLETLESKRKELEKRLEELQERRESSKRLDEPSTEIAETKEQAPEQPVEMTVTAANDGDHLQNEEAKERRKEEKKRKWM